MKSYPGSPKGSQGKFAHDKCSKLAVIASQLLHLFLVDTKLILLDRGKPGLASIPLLIFSSQKSEGARVQYFTLKYILWHCSKKMSLLHLLLSHSQCWSLLNEKGSICCNLSFEIGFLTIIRVFLLNWQVDFTLLGQEDATELCSEPCLGVGKAQLNRRDS